MLTLCSKKSQALTIKFRSTVSYLFTLLFCGHKVLFYGTSTRKLKKRPVVSYNNIKKLILHTALDTHIKTRYLS